MNADQPRMPSGDTRPLYSRREWLGKSTALTAGLATLAAATAVESALPQASQGTVAANVPTRDDTFALLRQGRRIPVIFDTDIGNDIDDTWALVLLMKSPELDVKLLVADAGNTIYRARLLAKMMEAFQRHDMPIGVGVEAGDRPGNQSAWLGDYQLSQYQGPVHEDGVQAMIDTIHTSPDPVTVIAIGGVPTVAEALRRDPTIVGKARFVGMHGSVYRGYGEGSKPVAEANVKTDPQALATVFDAAWECSVTPLDTCDRVALSGEKYRRVYSCPKAEIRALMDNYQAWHADWIPGNFDRTRRSTTLFDLVAVYMAFSEQLLKMQELPLRVTDRGMTVVDPAQRSVRCALDWHDLAAFEDLIVQRLIA